MFPVTVTILFTIQNNRPEISLDIQGRGNRVPRGLLNPAQSGNTFPGPDPGNDSAIIIF